MADEAFSGRTAACEEVARLLQGPDDLKHLKGLLADFSSKHQATRQHLGTTVSTQVEATRSGLELLESARNTLKTLRDCYANIDKLCGECTQLVQHQDKIQALSAVHYNLGKTLQDVQNIVALPLEAQEAESMLQEDVQLVQAYEVLSILEGTASMAQQALQKGSKLHQEDSHNVDFYFNKVRDTMAKFEKRLWAIVRNFVELGRSQPAQLVNVVRIIELQEMVDRQLEANPSSTVQPKRWKRRCTAHIGMSLNDSFAPLQQMCSQLAAAGEDTDKRSDEILTLAQDFAHQLGDIYDYVSPCFPEKYKIFDVIFKQQHELLVFMIDCIGACADQLANGDIIKVMAWMAKYQEMLKDVCGLDDAAVTFPEHPRRGCVQLVAKYVERVEATLNAWFTNILKVDMREDPKQAEDGRLWTPGAVDFFRILNEQVNVVAEVSRGLLLLHLGEAILAIMRAYQDAQHTVLREELPDSPERMLCAMINNNATCYDECEDFADRLEELLEDPFKEKLDVEAQSRGFLDLTREAQNALVAGIFREPALLALFHSLCHTAAWRQGTAIQAILATLADYFEDYSAAIQPAFFKRVVEHVLEEVVAHYIAQELTALELSKGRPEKEEIAAILAALQSDRERLDAFFSEHFKPEKVHRATKPLEYLRALVENMFESVDGCVLSYNILLEVMPGIMPSLLEQKIIGLRSDLTRADIRKVMEEFKDAYATRQKALGLDASLLHKPKAAVQAHKGEREFEKDKDFKIALQAVQRKLVPKVH